MGESLEHASAERAPENEIEKGKEKLNAFMDALDFTADEQAAFRAPEAVDVLKAMVLARKAGEESVAFEGLDPTQNEVYASVYERLNDMQLAQLRDLSVDLMEGREARDGAFEDHFSQLTSEQEEALENATTYEAAESLYAKVHDSEFPHYSSTPTGDKLSEAAKNKRQSLLTKILDKMETLRPAA
jgi:hypothetical protein